MKRQSASRGGRTSGVELANVSVHGLWLLVDGREFYLPFDEFPWFRDATIAELAAVERPSREHLYWPQLDVDLTLDSLAHPDDYPLVSRPRADSPVEPAARVRERPPRYRTRKHR